MVMIFCGWEGLAAHWQYVAHCGIPNCCSDVEMGFENLKNETPTPGKYYCLIVHCRAPCGPEIPEILKLS